MSNRHKMTEAEESQRVLLRALGDACRDFAADPVERLALFEAAIVACDLCPGATTDGEHLGVLGQNSAWGPAAARRDTYTAAMVFLKEARRVRVAAHPRRPASRLAGQVQGTSSWRYARAYRSAKRTLSLVRSAEQLTLTV